jgi:D-serine deaminase-like pyridoxal phosphate-dependent protein
LHIRKKRYNMLASRMPDAGHAMNDVVGTPRDELETPIAVVDLDRLEANIRRLQAYLNEHSLANWPHIKTHKIPAIAQMQLAAGAAGITCQTLGEAEVMAQAGCKHIFLPYNLVGAAKLRRLIALAQQAQISVTADSIAVVMGLAEAVEQAGVTLEVLVEFDTGAQRCGVQSPEEALRLARAIDGSPGLRFGGLMTYPYNVTTDEFVAKTKTLCEGVDLRIERVSIGGTAGMYQAHTCRSATEYRAGMYIYGDRNLLTRGAMELEECSFNVISTVVSRPTATRGIIDGGSKTFSSDLLGLEGHGLILEYPEARIYTLSEEHGHVDFSPCRSLPTIGERLTIIPNHCCVVNNLFRAIIGLRNGHVEVVWSVVAR